MGVFAKKKEKSRLKDSIKETDNRADEWIELTEKTFNFCTYARYWFKNGSSEQKKQILYALGSNPLIKDGKLNIHLYDQWNIIKDAQDDFPKAKRMFEPPKSGLNKRKTAVLPTDFLSWQARRDSNPQDRLWRPTVYQLTDAPLLLHLFMKNMFFAPLAKLLQF